MDKNKPLPCDAWGKASSTSAVSAQKQAAAFAIATPLLSACGGGGGGGSTATAQPSPPAVLNYTPAEAARFLLQAQFSCSPADVQSVRTLGFEAWLTQQFTSQQSQTATAWLDSRNFFQPDEKDKYFNPVPGDWMAWRMMMTGEDQLRKRCALALSEIIVVSLSPIDGFWPPYVIAAYWDLLNAHAFGNFRTLLEEITLNPAMGFYLNTKGNQKADPTTGRVPDENYAREIMQLFTIGLTQLNSDGTPKLDTQGRTQDTYSQADITNLARVFTGYDWNYDRVTWQSVPWLTYKIPSPEFSRDRMKLDPAKHSDEAVSFLGVNIPANTPASEALRIALDTLFNHPNTAPFLAKQMIQRLVTSNPSPAYVGRVAAAFANNGTGVRGDMKSVWRAILLDPEARTLSASVTSGKLREPIVRFAQWARTFQVSSSTGTWEIYDTSNGDWGLGQSPLRSPSVFNFFRPGYVPPQTALSANQLVAPEFQIHNETTTAGYLNFLTSVIKSGYRDVKPDYSVIIGISHQTRELLDWLNLYLAAGQVSDTTLGLIQSALDAQPLTSTSSETAKLDRIYSAILLIMASPEYLVQK